MDDISLYIDYIIVSSFCTPVSSFSLPLQPGFEYSQIKGAIDPCDISFKLDDKKYRTSALGELKDNIVQFLELDNVDVSKWDYQRERFFSMIDEATTN